MFRRPHGFIRTGTVCPFTARFQSNPSEIARNAERQRASASQGASKTSFDYDAIVRPAQTWNRDDVAAFCKVREEHGGLSNMSNDHGYEDQGLKWKSSEEIGRASCRERVCKYV